MKLAHILLLCLLAVLSISSRFNIASTSTCTNTSATGFCTKWEQNGTVEQETAACFSENMVVLTKDQGFRYFSELKVNDQILSFDREHGQQIYTSVQGWLHREVNAQSSYLKIALNNGQSIRVSHKHNLAVKDNNNGNAALRYLFGEQITKDLSLFGTEKNIQYLSVIKQRGMYSPLTSNNNYFVFTSKNQETNQKILAHDFANLRNPEQHQTIVNLVIDGYELFNGKSINFDTIHPAAQWMMDNFQFMME